ncbi:MAG: hypothetical protein U5L11_09100 [Arhodomonas sp.]|nr:hypothetical protein [Arhodomonas sp.]
MTHEHWGSRLAFILAAVGSAVGLGNVWKFPYITGENGGGAFVPVYRPRIAPIGLPILIAEILIGRRGQRSPIRSLSLLARREGACHHSWGGVGLLGYGGGVRESAVLQRHRRLGAVLRLRGRLRRAPPAPVPTRSRPVSPPCWPARCVWCSGTPYSCCSPSSWWPVACGRAWSGR